jgi:protein SCO1
MRTRIFCSLTLLTILSFLSSSCSAPAREYELKGQILAVDEAQHTLTIRHDDIPGFMPGMTMPFKVRDLALLEGRVPGDLVRATLAVTDTDAYLTSVDRVGHVELTAAEPPPGAPAPVAVAGDEAPDAELIDETGRRRRLSEWRGSVVAVTFIYTRCPVPNFCPLMDRHFLAVQRALAADPQLAARAHLLSVSFDPDHDTPEVLAAHARRIGADPARWTFVTGARDELDPFAARFGVTTIRDDATDWEIVHNLRTAVIDPQGRIVTIFSGNEWTPTDLLRVMRAAGA